MGIWLFRSLVSRNRVWWVELSQKIKPQPGPTVGWGQNPGCVPFQLPAGVAEAWRLCRHCSAGTEHPSAQLCPVTDPKPAPRGCRGQNRHEPQDTAEHFPPPGTELTKGTRCLRSEENSPGAPGESRRRQDGLQAPRRDSPAAPGDTGLEQGGTRLKRSGREEQLRAEHHPG